MGKYITQINGELIVLPNNKKHNQLICIFHVIYNHIWEYFKLDKLERPFWEYPPQ